MRTVKDGNVCVEVYKGKLPTTQEIEQEKDKALSRHQDEIGKLKKEKANYQKLGFEAQAEIVDTKLQTVKRKAMAEEGISPEKFGYQVVSSEDMAIWALWLPSEYREKEFPNYQFDQIPQIALDEYAMAKELRMFETFTIRTPERERVQDPAIFGYFWRMVNGELKKVPVLITRWAESLRPLEEIKRIIKESDRASDRSFSLFFWSSLMMLIGCIGIFWGDNILYVSVPMSAQQFEFLMFLFFFLLVISGIAGGIVTVIVRGLWPTRFNAKAILNRSRQLPSL